MSATLTRSPRPPSRASAPAAMPRILSHPAATTWLDHQSRYGQLAGVSAGLIDEVDAAGLRGRGGAGFPTAIKMRAVRTASGQGRGGRRHAPVVVANGTEGEPASAKDKVLIRCSPHLVLDGMVAAATAVGSDRAVLCVDRGDRQTIAAARAALHERARRDRVRLTIQETPSRYVAGEETALVSWLNGGKAKPTFAPPRPAERGVGAAPTLVDNVETLANVALIARYGAAAWRSVGEADEPGSVLATVVGAVAEPGVYEFETGRALSAVLRDARVGATSGVLVGGYFGTWLTPSEADQAVFSTSGLRRFGASIGCGLIAVMPRELCPLQEVSTVLRWLAANSAGQCGVCVNGLPALVGAFDHVVSGDRDGSGEAGLDRWAPMIAGRGGCKLPDGAIRFLDSARRVYADHIAYHHEYGPCRPNATQVLPTPQLGGWR